MIFLPKYTDFMIRYLSGNNMRSKMWLSLKIGAINVSKLLKGLRVQVHLMKFFSFK
jgi:hypothetical protein